MTSNIKIPKISKENNTAMKNLVGKKITKKHTFMGEKVDIAKLTVGQVKEIQEKIKKMNAEEGEADADIAGLELIRAIIMLSCADAADLEESDFEEFPLEELSSLSAEIMKFSGMAGTEGK